MANLKKLWLLHIVAQLWILHPEVNVWRNSSWISSRCRSPITDPIGNHDFSSEKYMLSKTRTDDNFGLAECRAMILWVKTLTFRWIFWHRNVSLSLVSHNVRIYILYIWCSQKNMCSCFGKHFRHMHQKQESKNRTKRVEKGKTIVFMCEWCVFDTQTCDIFIWQWLQLFRLFRRVAVPTVRSIQSLIHSSSPFIRPCWHSIPEDRKCAIYDKSLSATVETVWQ